MRWLAGGLLRRLAGGDGAPAPRSPRPGAPALPVRVLSPGPLPTTDYYLAARARAAAGEVRVVDTLSTPAAPERLPEGVAVVIVRHAPAGWLRLLRRRRAALGRIALLLDDDTPGALAAPELPFGYALRTSWRHAAQRRALEAVLDELWVSTPELARRWAACAPRVLAPLWPDGEAPGRDAPAPPVYFYHGTGAHRRELQWLAPVVEAVQSAVPEARFEVVGGAEARRLFRGLPRVDVVAQQPWPAYRQASAARHLRLGLAPSLDTAFNRARAHVKFFDITRLGAAGLYAEAGPCGGIVRDGETGWLCPDDPAAWVRAIRERLADPEACRRVQRRAAAACLEGAAGAQWP